jgi:predicted component of type VI protein secretion system
MQSTYELVIEDAGMTTVVPLLQDELLIGRTPGSHILLTERNVSRRHARLRTQGDCVGIEDLDSYTGVLVNGQRIAGPAALADGDQVQIGDYRMALRRVAVTLRPRPRPTDAQPPAPTPQPMVAPAETQAPAGQLALAKLPPVQTPPRPVKPTGARTRVAAALATAALIGGLLYQRSAPPPHKAPAHLAPSRVTTTPPPARPSAPIAAPRVAPPPTPPAIQAPPAAVAPPRHVRRAEHPRLAGSTPAPAPVAPPAAAEQTAELTTDLIVQAQSCYLRGDYQEAIRLARKVQHMNGEAGSRAWRILGGAACRLGDAALVHEAYRRVDVIARQYLRYVCQQSGFVLSGGRVVPAT